MVVKKKSKSAVIKSKWVVSVPVGAEVVVSEGMKVERGETLLICDSPKVSSYDASWILSRMSPNRLEELKASLYDKEFEEGSLLFADGGLFPKKIYSPCNGKFCGIDEFLNIQFKTVIHEKRKIKAPVDSRVLKLEKEKLTLEFNSRKYEGIGLVDGKVWGESDLKIRNKISDLTSALAGKLVFATEIDPAYVIKAEVIKVAGIVLLKPAETDLKDMEIDFPVLVLEKTEWDRLMDNTSTEEERMMLLNSKIGRLLLVVK